MSEIQVACLDLDGHLGHTIPRIKKYHMDHYVDLYGTSPDEAYVNLVDEYVGRGAEEVFRALHAERFAGRSEKAQDRELTYLDKGFGIIARDDPYPALPILGVPEELERLNKGGVELFLVTNRRSETIKKTLRAAGIRLEFDADHIYAGERNKKLAGKAGSVREIKRAHNLRREQISMSGDDVKDVEAGVAAGALAFGVPRPELRTAEKAAFRHNVEKAGGIYYPTLATLGQTALLPLST